MLVRAQVTLQGGSGLPEDRFVNTFHFFNATWADLADAVADIDGPLKAFYITPYSGNTIGSFISVYAGRVFTIRYYDMSQAEPRVPQITTGTLPASTSGTTPLPEEVAIVSSFHGGPPVTPNTRGRVYLGPLNSGVLAAATTLLPTRVASNVRASIAAAASALSVAAIGWVVYSPTTGLQTLVTGGFINNDLDTQRRRGPKADTRTIWPLP